MKTQSIPELVSALRLSFNQNRMRSLSDRQQQLSAMECFIKECQSDIEAALYQDLKKPLFEIITAEVSILLAEIKFIRKHLASWMKTIQVSSAFWPGKSWICPEPLGVVLVMGAWNYPLQLSLLPLIGAIAAGNCAVVKPSEMAPATSALIANALPRYLDPNCVQVVEGDIAKATQLLQERFDYIFFTGNKAVGRIIMEAAAKHLTPVTLELGGKSPCIVDKDINLELAARRIVWGKFSNAGQTCVAPDYVLSQESVMDELLYHMKNQLLQFYTQNPEKSSDYGRIINKHHYQRLMNLLSTVNSKDIFFGGEGDENNLYIAPTLLKDIAFDAPIMKEEIFGPILPVLKVKTIDEAIAFIHFQQKPLALYFFSNNKKTQQHVLQSTSSGSVCLNHVLLQASVQGLPFGGVGQSGNGCYHGKASFKTFSHYKAVLKSLKWPNLSSLYPPYSKRSIKWIRKFFL